MTPARSSHAMCLQRLDVPDGRLAIPVRIRVGEQLHLAPQNTPDELNSLDVFRAADLHLEMLQSERAMQMPCPLVFPRVRSFPRAR